MKKYFIIATGMIIAFQGLSAITSQEIIASLQAQANKYKEAINPSISMPGQVRSQRATEFKNAFNDAKNFVINNSAKDADLTKPMNALDVAHINIINIVDKLPSLTSGIQLNQMKKLLIEEVQKNIDLALNNLSKVTFFASNKKQIRETIKSIGNILKEIIEAISAVITTQAKEIAPALPPRKPQTAPTATQTSTSSPLTTSNLPPAPKVATKFILTAQMKTFLEKEINNDSAAHLEYIRRLLVAHADFAIASTPVMIQNEERLQQVFEEILTKFKNAYSNELQKFKGQSSAFLPIAEFISETVIKILKLRNNQDVTLVNQAIAKAVRKVLVQ